MTQTRAQDALLQWVYPSIHATSEDNQYRQLLQAQLAILPLNIHPARLGSEISVCVFQTR